MNSTTVLSDLHLGAYNCQANAILNFLKTVPKKDSGHTLVLNGDVFDDENLSRLNDKHWKIIEELQKIECLVWVAGNHDSKLHKNFEILLHARRQENYEITVNTYENCIKTEVTKYLLLHGHQFDNFLENNPWTVWIGDLCYNFFQRIDGSHRLARFAKHTCKSFMKVAEEIREAAFCEAKKLSVNTVICSHTHKAEDITDTGGVRYINTGCWTEKPCHYVTIDEEGCKLREWR